MLSACDIHQKILIYWLLILLPLADGGQSNILVDSAKHPQALQGSYYSMLYLLLERRHAGSLHILLTSHR